MRIHLLLLASLSMFSCSSPETSNPWELNNGTNNGQNNGSNNNNGTVNFNNVFTGTNNGVTTQTTSSTTATNNTTQTNNGTVTTTTGTTNNFPTPVEHRPMAISCDNLRPPGAGGDKNSACTKDADCVDGDNGRCNFGRTGGRCTYDLCFNDDDCNGSVCACESPNSSTVGNHCLAGNCTIDSDCPDTGFCSPTFGGCGNYSGDVAYFCHTQEDECIDDSDCADFQGPGNGTPYCKFSAETNNWVCDNAHCVG